MNENELPHIIDCEKAIEVDSHSFGPSIWFWRNGKVSTSINSPTESSYLRVMSLFNKLEDQVKYRLATRYFAMELLYKN